MLRKTPTRSLPKLPSTPGMADIHTLLSRSLEHRGESFEICWTPADGHAEYALGVECGPKGGDAEWRMYLGTGPRAVLLWTYVSCDVLLVYNLVVSSCGDTVEKVPSNGGQKEAEFNKSSEREAYERMQNLQTQSEIPKIDRTREQEAYRASNALMGDLAHVQMPTLLQSIKMAKMSGRLKIESKKRVSEIYVVDGNPVHATAADTRGEESIYEVLTWKEGSFVFEPKAICEDQSIAHSLDALLLQGMQLIDHAAYLRNAGLTPDAVIAKKHKELGENEFESLVLHGAPLPIQLQKKFYSAIDDHRTVKEVLEKLKMPRSQWIPLMCNMIRCDLISIRHGRTAKTSDRSQLEPKSIDKRAIQNVMMSLRRPETGMFTHPAFLYFLEQEFFRGYRSASPISVIIFQMRMLAKSGSEMVREPIPLTALGEAVRRISRVKRHVDLLAHYETYDYALLLPNTKTGGALIFANRVVKALQSEPLAPGLGRSNLSLAFGIACIPEDFLDLSMLLSAAEVAKDESVKTGQPVILFRDMPK